MASVEDMYVWYDEAGRNEYYCKNRGCREAGSHQEYHIVYRKLGSIRWVIPQW